MTTSTSRSKRRRGPGAVSRALGIAAIVVLLAVLAYAVNAAIGMNVRAQNAGTISKLTLLEPARIVRDDRGIAHIEAANDHDLFFAQGFAEGSDRLFQMDLLRRFVYGRLAEVLGPAVLSADENARIVDVRGIVSKQWVRMSPHERSILQAFADGVNAARLHEPLPVEFRLLLYKPEPWKPQDSLAAGMATVLDLIDPWDDVIARDRIASAHPAIAAALYSITDPKYDAPIAPPSRAPVPPVPANTGGGHVSAAVQPVSGDPPLGSNEWAVGALHSQTGRALLANDPHLRIGIPGVWYLVDLHSNDLHVAGATLAGTPGVILGHDDFIAWGATNATVTTESVYRVPLDGARTRTERFHVRFGRDVTKDYLETNRGFVAQIRGKSGFAVDWNAANDPVTPLTAFEGLDRARSIADALEALRSYPGPPQNFVIAEVSGAAAYHVAGLIPDDPLWSLRVHPKTDPSYPYIAFDRLPHVDSSRSAIVFTANNQMYGRGYPYRLSPRFAPPYRAFRIEELLHSKDRFGVNDFAAFQTDTLSYPELAVARDTLAALRRKHLENDSSLAQYAAPLAQWNGRYDPDSRGAPIAWELRRFAEDNLARYTLGPLARQYEEGAHGANVVLLMRVLRERPRGWWPRDDYDDLLVRSLRDSVARDGKRLLQTWGAFDPVSVRHPLAALGFDFLNGATFPGDGDRYGLHVQTTDDSQSFRAVWDVGNWDAGGIVIPSGESGEPGSGHYTDLSRTWIAQRLVPLPFSDAAVRAAARETLTLTP